MQLRLWRASRQIRLPRTSMQLRLPRTSRQIRLRRATRRGLLRISRLSALQSGEIGVPCTVLLLRRAILRRRAFRSYPRDSRAVAVAGWVLAIANGISARLVFHEQGIERRCVQGPDIRCPGIQGRYVQGRGAPWPFPVVEFSFRERVFRIARRPPPDGSPRVLPVAGGVQPPLRLGTALACPAPGSCDNQHDDQRNAADQAGSYHDRASENKQMPSGLSAPALDVAEKTSSQA
jgi:hypothetical protein